MIEKRRIYINSRYKYQRVTGVQRYAREVMSAMQQKIYEVEPLGIEKKLFGQIWEQAVLPLRIPQKSVLWSPANLGPVYKKNHVVTIHDMATFDNPDWFDKKFALIYKLLLPSIAKSADRIITVSEFSKNRIVDILDIDPEKIHVTYLGASGFGDNTHVEKFLDSDPYFLYVGSLEPRKNLSRLFGAWKKLQQLPMFKKGIKLKVVGMAGKSFSSTGFTVVPENVEVCGYLSDVELDKVYRNSMGLVYPSLYEGFGLPPLEAMTRGVPVITSLDTSMAEIVGKAAVLIDPYSEDDIYQSIKMLAENNSLRESLIQLGLERSKAFSWSRTAEETYKVLSGI